MRNRRLALAAALLLAITSADGAALAVSGADFSSEEVSEAVFDEGEMCIRDRTLAGGAVKTVNVTIQKGTVKTTKISGVPKKITLKKGKKQTLAPILAPITTQQKVTYTTSNKKVCTVTKGGVITAKKKGTAKVTVRSGSKKVIITVKVW